MQYQKSGIRWCKGENQKNETMQTIHVIP